jgi:hypothetical protein
VRVIPVIPQAIHCEPLVSAPMFGDLLRMKTGATEEIDEVLG